MKSNLFFHFSIFFQLVRRDLLVFRYEFKDKFIDTVFMLLTNVLIFGYVMTHLGLMGNYGEFILIGAIASFGFFEVIGRVGTLITDICGDRTISYTLTLPLPSWAVFSYIAVSWAICSSALAIPLFPIGKLILLSKFQLTHFSLLRFIPIFLITNLFFGFFALWITTLIKDIRQINTIWFRIVNPCFMFGGYFYPWKALYDVSPVFGTLNLINPFLYIMEGMRAAVLGQQGYLPFIVSFLALCIFTASFGLSGIKRLKKRLDTP